MPSAEIPNSPVADVVSSFIDHVGNGGQKLGLAGLFLTAEHEPHSDREMSALFNRHLDERAKSLPTSEVAQLCMHSLGNAEVILDAPEKNGRRAWLVNPEYAETRLALVGFLGRWSLTNQITLENIFGMTRGQNASKSPGYRLHLYETLLGGSRTNIELGEDPLFQGPSRLHDHVSALKALGIVQQDSGRRISFAPQAVEPVQQLVDGVAAIQHGDRLGEYGRVAHDLLANEATFTALTTKRHAELKQREATLSQIILPLFGGSEAKTVHDVWTSLAAQNLSVSRRGVDAVMRALRDDGTLVAAGKAKGAGRRSAIKYRLANPPEQPEGS